MISGGGDSELYDFSTMTPRFSPEWECGAWGRANKELLDERDEANRRKKITDEFHRKGAA